MLTRIAFVVSLVFGMSLAHADESNSGSMDRQEFAAYESQVDKDLQDGKKYAEISATDLKTVKSKFASMDAHWQKADSAGILSDQDVSAIESDLADVGKILHRAFMASRPVCDMEVPTGSRVAVLVCRTPAQIRSDKEAADTELRRMNVHEGH